MYIIVVLIYDIDMSIKSQLEDNKNRKSILPVHTKEEAALRSLMLTTIEQYRTLVFPEAYEIIKNKMLFHWDLRAALNIAWRTHSTAQIAPLISGRFDAFAANLYDTSMIPRVSAVSEEDKELASLAQDFCDWSHDISDADQAKQLARNEAGLIGTSHGIAWWDKREHKKAYVTPNWNKIFKKSVSKPTLDHVSFFEMFYPLATTDFYKAPRKARRKILSLSECKKRYESLIKFNKTKEEQIVASKNNVLCNFDFTKIYEIKSYEHLYEKWHTAKVKYNISNPISFLEDNVLLAIGENNPFCEVIEYFEWDDLTIMINGNIYYDDASPYPLWDPFWIIVYERMPWTCRGMGMWQKLMPYQKQATFYLCKIRDAAGSSLDPSYIVTQWVLTDSTGKTPQVISHMPWITYQRKAEYTGNVLEPMQRVDYNILSLAIGQYQQQFVSADEAIGTNSYVQWWQGKVERSFWAANMKAAVAITRLKPINNSISRFDQHMFEQRLSLASVFNDDEFAIKVLGKNGYEYKKIKPDILLDKFDITIDIQALRDMTKAERSQWVLNALNSIAPYNMNPISQTPTISPEKVISFVAGMMDYEWFDPMNEQERIEYVKQELNIQKQIKESQQPEQTEPLWAWIPQAPMMPWVPNMWWDIDINQLPPMM